MMTGAAFLRGMVAAFPYALHTVLTDNGVAFAHCAVTKWDGRVHVFDRFCRAHGITHKRTRVYRPGPRAGGADKPDRKAAKDAMVKAFHDDTRADQATHVAAFVTADNGLTHLKRLRWRTPFQAICDAWANDPGPFKINPHHLILGPHA